MIDAPALLTFLQNEEQRATDTTLNQERKTALEFYRGDPFGDEVDGRSKLRTRDVAEVCDYMCVSILRTFVSGDKIVEFEPIQPILQSGPPDAQGQPTQNDVSQELAQEATERVQWNFMREQDGYAIIHDGLKAGLLEKSGIWKSWVERPMVRNQSRMNSAEIEQAGKAVVHAKPVEGMYDTAHRTDETGQPMFDEFGQPSLESLQVYDAHHMVQGPPKFRDAAIPNDEFFVAPDARTLETAIYLGNISRVSLADLIGMGYEEADVANLYGNTSDGQELRDARDSGRAENESNIVRTDLSRMVVLREEYARIVWEGSYQLVRVHRVGSTLLSAEPVEDHPYTLWCPFPMQHRLIGDSLADKTMDIQVVRSHMLRQAMDALYIANAPRLYVDMNQADETTIDDTLDVAPGGLIRGNGPNAVTALTQPFAAGHAFEAMEIMAGEKESRTGITRLNQGLDADALNKTATGTALMQAQGQQIEEYVARNAANAIGKMFDKKRKLMTAEMQPHQFRIDGTPREINPASWPQDMRVNIRVGLGSGSKDKQIGKIQMLMAAQGEAFQANPRMVGPEQMFNTGKLMVETLGFGLATKFFADPATFQQEPPKPDPEAMKAQAQIQQAQMTMQLHQQTSAAKLQLQQQESMAKLELMRQQGAAKAQIDAQKAISEAQLAQARAQAEAQLAEQQMHVNAMLDMAELHHKAAQAQQANAHKLRDGGKLNA